jgi:membrane protease YdiL (CAAX protease family)
VCGVLVTVVVGVVMALASVAEVPLGAGDQLFANPTWDTAAGLLVIAVWTPAVLFTARWVQRRPIGSVSSVAGRLRGRWLLSCGSAAIVYVMLFFAAFFLLFSLFDTSVGAQDELGWVGWSRFLAPAIVILLLVPLQAAAEEYVFRGWLLQAVGTYFRSSWPGIILSSVLFCLVHGILAENIWAFADFTLFGVVLAVLTIRTGGLEAGIALHTVHNYALFLLLAATGELELASPVDYSGYPWQLLAATAVALAVFAVLVGWLARRRGLATVTAPAADATPERSVPA